MFEVVVAISEFPASRCYIQRVGKRAAYIFLIFSLLLVQFSGLHLHLCTGEERSTAHASAHYADDGLLFGEHHQEDDSDDIEASFPGATFSSSSSAHHQPDFSFDFTWVLYEIPAVESPNAPFARVAIHTQPQVPLPSQPPDLPPARGPPSYS